MIGVNTQRRTKKPKFIEPTVKNQPKMKEVRISIISSIIIAFLAGWILYTTFSNNAKISDNTDVIKPYTDTITKLNTKIANRDTLIVMLRQKLDKKVKVIEKVHYKYIEVKEENDQNKLNDTLDIESIMLENWLCHMYSGELEEESALKSSLIKELDSKIALVESKVGAGEETITRLLGEIDSKEAEIVEIKKRERLYLIAIPVAFVIGLVI